MKKRLPLLFSSLLLILFPLINFKYKVFRGLSCHFLHHFEKIASFPVHLPPLFQKYIHFTYADILIVAFFIGVCLLREMRVKELLFNRHSRYLTFYFFAALGSIVFSLFAGYFLQYATLLNLMLSLLVFHLTFLFYRNRLDLIPKVLTGFLIVSLLECLIGVGQFLMQHDLGLQFLSEPIIHPFRDNIAVFDLNPERHTLSWWLSWIPQEPTRILRSHGTFDHPNIFAGYLVISLFVSYFTYIHRKKGWTGSFLLSLILLQIVTLILTFSRGGIFTCILGSALFFCVGFTKKVSFTPLMKKRMIRLGIFIGGGLLLTLVLLFPYLWDRGGILHYNLTAAASDEGRLLYLRLACVLLLSSPWLGIGFNGFALHPAMEGVNPSGGLAHYIYLQTAAETGLIGLAFFLLFIASLFKPYLKKPCSPLSFTLAVIFFSILLMGMVDHFWIAYAPGRLMFFLFAGLLAASNQERKAADPPFPSHAK